ncbi:MAG TPA: glycoside hydrolase family 38 C-terminal domain-containing protein [Steroidobacteraceae bacterium]|nr:glycoside hydrolase family 38 C-terminal domain-containing protein [Steroidobacteraceae bacterium]
MRTHHLLQLVPNRVAAAVDRLSRQIWTRIGPVTVEATDSTAEHLAWPEAMSNSRSGVLIGSAWGRLYDQRWCRLDLTRASDSGEARTEPWYLEWRDQAEATLYVQGVPYFGFDVAHRYCRLPVGLSEAWVESICVQSGIWHPDATGLSAAGSVFDGAFLVRRDDAAWDAYHDLNCLLEVMLAERPGGPQLNSIGQQAPLVRVSPSYRRLLRLLDQSIDALDRGGIGELRRSLAAAYEELRDPAPYLKAVLTGHAHIDLVWLWPERVGEAKAIHTFATADRLMDLYPEFRFVHSQPASYEAVARRSPALYERVKGRIGTGQWEATGVLYVESDSQLPCGEALARSFTLGQQSFEALRGAPARVVWLPDAFGYSGCLPQLMKLSGADYFFTNKVAWSAVNRFPVSSFIWRGSDGSEVLAHVLQEVGYNGTAQPDLLKLGAEAHLQSDVHPEYLYPTGYGDGGGGVTAEICERARRLASIRGQPAVSWDLPEAFFSRLAGRRELLPTYNGEFYLEFHRGTFTTHANIKAAFRKLECALQVREAAAVAGETAPDLSQAWRRLVFAQFHDYIPGSSVPEVYAEALPELTRLAAELRTAALTDLASAEGVPCLFNALAIPCEALTSAGLVRVPPLSGIAAKNAVVTPAAPIVIGDRTLANDHVFMRIDEMGELSELVVGGEAVALCAGAGGLVLYPDRPANFESWDIDRQSLSLGERVRTPPEISLETDLGGLRAAWVVRRRLGTASRSILRYVLDAGSRVLRLEIQLDWHEAETLLKLHFKTDYHGSQVRCGAPFGSVLRPQQPGALAAEAMWEIPASRWMAGTDDGGRRGMFIVAESKYGYSCDDGDWAVSLVRSPRMTGFEAHRHAYPAGLSRVESPSIYSDQGVHSISLAIGRYDAAATMENHPAALADSLFTQPLPYVGRECASALIGMTGSQTLIPCWAKPAGAEDWVLRLHEVSGERGSVRVQLRPGWSAQRVDLRERPCEARVTDEGIAYRPYEIVSLRIRRSTPQAVSAGPSSSMWEGYRCDKFVLDGRDCILVRPDVPMQSQPWIWRTEFFGEFPALDLALLKAGFHVAYIDMRNMYGAPAAMRIMDEYYAHLTGRFQLSTQCVLEGLSRGALFALNWAARSPQSVACLYLDAPVCDFKSWPGGKGRAAGSAEDWRRLKQIYGFTEEEALAYPSNPVDALEPIAAAGIPIIAVYGDADVGLPPEENILLLEGRYRALGGDITVIAKPGVGHHPHGLPDPTPLSNFILSRMIRT